MLITEVHNYIKAHPDQDAVVALILLFAFDTPEIEIISAMLTERARNSLAANLYKAVNRNTVVRNIESTSDWNITR